ncbi:MAG: flagellar hook basal-body protein [Eubacteriales bacterium]
MVRGFYAAASGALSQQKSINVISNNIANATTPGYKSQMTVGLSFGEHMVSRINGGEDGAGETIGNTTDMKIINSDYMDLTQGSLETTGRSVDMGISGEGYFLIKDDKNVEMITKNGQFAMDKDGFLTLPGVGFVMNESKGKIKLNSTAFSVDSAGNITDSKGLKEKLFIGKPSATSTIVKVGAGVLTSKDAFAQVDGKTTNVVQGCLEKSNVDMAVEMTRIIAAQGNFQSCTQILKIYDRINEITANQIGRIG